MLTENYELIVVVLSKWQFCSNEEICVNNNSNY